MRKPGFVLFIAMIMLALYGCKRSGTGGSIKPGMYLSEKDRMGPCLYFDEEKKSWHSSPGMMYSVFLAGEYEIRGDKILARESGSSQIVMELRIISAERLRVEKLSEELLRLDSFWIVTGDEYVYYSYPESTTDIDSLFRTVTRADGALQTCLDNDVVVIEGSQCTSGREVWDAFYAQVSSGSPDRVLIARYYVLDREHVSEELYQQEKDQYPKLFYYLVEYDGQQFRVTVRKCDEESLDFQGNFTYLKHYVGDLPVTAVARHYDRYVLVDDPEVSWEAIMRGLYSSDSTVPRYRHLSLYEHLYD